ncbi:glycosyltransferase [Marivivens sp. LCG002]|uniref:glycosyltransferase family 2 protein n=1 Tax=Marivivens sp. LCG002 TaxID=3051171 RepID=UPI0025526576|nr:glycosyltransferase [Marivivens sp. LCG002]WIV50742.1 glycosyltransferase [Marivivens sp. LCG002]
MEGSGSQSPSVSVVIVTRDRPRSLALTLKGLRQQYYDNFEIVIVGNDKSLGGLAAETGIKLVRFDEPNISRARNLGVAQASGEIIAFIDDDAIPEPTWLGFLIAPIAQGKAEIAGGFVRGRNGISFQWKARWVDHTGQTRPLAVDVTSVFPPDQSGAAKTEGTNMAIRRDALIALGGFNEAYHFFLDETDLNLRAGKIGLRTAICPEAQVHHGYAESERRRGDRAPKTLFQIGASVAVFVREHTPSPDDAIRIFREQHRKWLLSLMVSGHIEPRDVARLLATFDTGLIEGAQRQNTFSRFDQRESFVALPVSPSPHIALYGHWVRAIPLIKKARRLVKQGNRVSLFLFSLGSRFHTVRFVRSGYWLQHGGLLGKSERSDHMIRLMSLKSRFNLELERVRKLRSNCIQR